jgi:squalene-hopene/tetraprenyl-beta-curcumene cyclase
VEDDEVFNPQACLSPVWDTALAMIALLDSGLPPDHPALVQAGRWLLREQVLTGGDWQVKASGVEPGGWSFEFENDLYPDTDDTAEVMIALLRTALPEKERKRRALERARDWLLGMQSKNGGWGAFDKDNTQRLVNEIPFCDFGEVIDPPSEDVTAHVIEALSMMGSAGSEAVQRGIRYLRNEQRRDGSWFGRWGVNHVYGTGGVLPALREAGVRTSEPYVRRALRWLLDHQNEDGGWGETCDSYVDPKAVGRGPSTASQTAWGLMGVIAAADSEDGLVRHSLERGVAYLLETQEEDGQWEEPYFTGTGFPGDFYIKYHLYRNYWPLMALGRYRRLSSGAA